MDPRLSGVIDFLSPSSVSHAHAQSCRRYDSERSHTHPQSSGLEFLVTFIYDIRDEIPFKIFLSLFSSFSSFFFQKINLIYSIVYFRYLYLLIYAI